MILTFTCASVLLFAGHVDAQGELSPLGKSSWLLVGGASVATRASSFGGGIGIQLNGLVDGTIRYNRVISNSKGVDVLGGQVSVLLRRKPGWTEYLVALRCAIDKSSVGQSTAVYTPSVSFVFPQFTHDYAEFTLIPSWTLFMQSEKDLQKILGTGVSLAFRSLSHSGTIFFVEPGINMSHGRGATRLSGAISIGLMPKL